MANEKQKQVLVRLPESVYEKLIQEAEVERRSIAAQVTIALEERYAPASREQAAA